ncbi:MAG TPA: phosphonate ABC transporter, permease protein PhnE [Alphaproteobacteria bacterium]|nr:phosphonate ABC transporter, permease protein PhnE [Paracoccaceae bacterium]HCJ61564.1 phosphonate ABC transporter, permease protein PhnE [Alphaproteobacteria bacterium]HCY48076.1 phosphonate ABC transporter, permease protein PhnE [Alphaproteobacteria bacterium]|tara:strand:- start:195 stop:995 length:801 start_codon:yes stop_codon:yes gene_type:complete
MSKKPKYVPKRTPKIGSFSFVCLVAIGAIILSSIGDVAPSPQRIFEGIPRLTNLLGRMLPPNMEEEFIFRMFWVLIETMEIAIAGTFIGIFLSLPIAWFSAKGISPLGPFRWLIRGVVSLCRTIPDLVWALIFVSTVGLGAVAGTMTIVVDTLGFCGRFFAEAFEDTDPKAKQAIRTIGGNQWNIISSAIIPEAMPSLINTSLYALERAIRSSVVLGLVGAGGIGQELKVAFDLFQYKNASAIILAIFVIVMAMETLTDWLRKKVS